MNTCGNKRKQRAILGQTAVMMLTWTVATAVFDALDIFATILYDVESPAGYFSAVFSFLSVWYGLFQRKHDLAVLAQIGTKKINVKSNIADKRRQLKQAVKDLKEQKERFQKKWRADATEDNAVRSGAPKGTYASYEPFDADGKSRVFRRVRQKLSRRSRGGNSSGPQTEMTEIARPAESTDGAAVARASEEQPSKALLQQGAGKRQEMLRSASTARASTAAVVTEETTGTTMDDAFGGAAFGHIGSEAQLL